MIRRPEWWPPALWPGGSDPEGTPTQARLPDRRGREGGAEDPTATFLEAMTALSGAEEAVLYRLDRTTDAWRVEKRTEGEAGVGEEEIRAAGHPLTWCLREELVVQVDVGELLGGRRGGWALAGPVAGRERALVLVFRRSPPPGSRPGFQAALRHLEALAASGRRH